MCAIMSDTAMAIIRSIRSRAIRSGDYVLDHPAASLTPLCCIALGIEIAQYWPEFVPGAHAVAEFFRNVAYGLIGAVVFSWIIVEIPARRRRRVAYEFNKLAFEWLLTIGPSLLQVYRAGHPSGREAVDIWDRKSVSDCAQAIARTQPGFYVEQARTLRTGIDGVQLALDGIGRVQGSLDPDVAHAIGLFPGKVGLVQLLQIDSDGNGGMSPGRHAHITWELAEGARRLYAALRKSVPYVDFNIGLVELSDGTVLRNEESDFVRE